jgi:hypothetical protein
MTFSIRPTQDRNFQPHRPNVFEAQPRLRRLWLLASTLIFVVFFTTSLYAQAVAVAEVDGTVSDSSGKVIVGAPVTLLQTDTQGLHSTVTDGDGRYRATNLPPGPYTLNVKAPGFKDFRQTGIVLEVAKTIDINVTMSVGSVTETIEVTANASMVETKDSAIAQTMDQTKVVELPLNGRNLTQLLTLTGGGTTAPAGDLTGSKNIQGSNGSGTFSVAGGQANGVNYLLDGGDNNDSFSNVNLPIPFPDAVQEFSVQTNALQAQFGLHPGGVVNVVTKSGTNSYHGDLFEFLRNYDMNARPKGVVTPAGSVLQPTRDSLKRNQFGGTVGGRIIRDKLFFFGGYQQTVQRSNPSGTTAHVPTALTMKGDFSVQDAATSVGGCLSKAVQLKDPQGNPYPGNVIPQSKFDQSAMKLLSYLPVSPDPCGAYIFGQPSNNPDWQVIGRVDYLKSDRHNIYGRYYIYNYTGQSFFDGKNALTTGPNPGNKDQSMTATFGDTFTLNATTVNSFHATFDRRADNRGSAPNLFGPQALGMNISDNMADNYIQVTVGNYFNVACGTCAPGYFNVNNYQISDDFTKTIGAHQISFGFDGRKEQFNSTNNQQSNGQWTFSGGTTTTYTGDNLADLLLGHMSQWNQGNPLSDYMRQTVVALYVQDSWRATQHLTLNLGARWEPELPSVDKQCRGNQFSMAAFLAGTHSSQYPNAPAGLLFGKDQPNGCQFTTSHWLATSPRVGLVFDPKGDGKQTIRAAFGLMHDSTQLYYPERWTTNPPYASSISISNPSITAPFSNPWNGYVSPTGVSGNPFPGAAIFPANGVYVSIPPNVHDTYMLQWNLSYSKQIAKDWLATATYIGNRTNHILGAQEINMPLPLPGATAQNENARRPLTILNPTQGAYYNQIVQTDDGASSSYNGLLLKAEHRLANNFTVLGNYTWSHCISDYDYNGELSGVTSYYQNPLNRRGERSDCGFDRRHIFNASMVILSPGIGQGFAKKLTKDWQLAPIVSLYSGQPFNVTTGSDVSLTGITLDRPNVVPGVDALPHTLTQWFNPAVFAGGCNNATYAANLSCVPLGTFGNASRNIFHGPGTIQWDMSVTRKFQFTERFRTELRGEFFNIMNHANWNAPAAGLTSSTFGQITTFGSPRLVQLSMKMFF